MKNKPKNQLNQNLKKPNPKIWIIQKLKITLKSPNQKTNNQPKKKKIQKVNQDPDPEVNLLLIIRKNLKKTKKTKNPKNIKAKNPKKILPEQDQDLQKEKINQKKIKKIRKARKIGILMIPDLTLMIVIIIEENLGLEIIEKKLRKVNLLVRKKKNLQKNNNHNNNKFLILANNKV